MTIQWVTIAPLSSTVKRVCDSKQHFKVALSHVFTWKAQPPSTAGEQKRELQSQAQAGFRLKPGQTEALGTPRLKPREVEKNPEYKKL